VVRIATLRAVAHRFSFPILMLLSFVLLMVGKIDAVLVDALRARVSDAVAPILDAMSRPAASVATMVEEIGDLSDIRAENDRLRQELATLRQYQDVVFRLEAENLVLRNLLNYTPDVTHSFVTARVIADNSGAFVRSLAINLGRANGVRDGQAVLGGRGLVGRIVQAGERSARVLLITDLNAHIPTVVERTQQRAVVAGDNSDRLRLLYLPQDASVRVGDRLLTSGHGGLFPPGLPIGIVASVQDGGIRVQPFESLDDLTYVKIVDFRTVESDASMQAAPGFVQ
jgi:rod shape-determining protein MreC